MESRVTNLETRMTRLEHIVVGNGSPGLDEVIRGHADQLAALNVGVGGATEKLDALIARQATKDAEEAARQKLLRQIRGLAVALLTLMGGGGWYIVDALRTLGGS